MAAILGFGDYFGWAINGMTDYGWFSLSQSHSLSNLWDRAPERARHGTHNQLQLQLHNLFEGVLPYSKGIRLVNEQDAAIQQKK